MKLNLSMMLFWLSCFVSNTGAQAFATDLSTLPHWVNESEKTVYFIPKAHLTYSISHIGADDTYSDLFNFELKYDGFGYIEQIATLKKAYPAYEIARPILEKQAETYLVAIAGTSWKAELKVKPNMDGPYLSEQIFLNKSDGALITAALTENPNGISVQGVVGAVVPTETLVERYESTQTCEEIIKGNHTVRGIVESFAVFKRSLENVRFRFSSTKDSTIDSLMDCFSLQEEVHVHTFRELLNQAIQTRQNSKPSGSTKKSIPILQKSPVYFDVSVEK